MNKNAFPIGTVVMLNSDPAKPAYGVVIDRDFWLENATTENQSNVDFFLKGEKECGEGKMIPIFFLGNVIDSQLVKVGEEIVERNYLQKYGYSNIGNTHLIGGGVSHLMNIFWHIQQVTRYSISYIESASSDIDVLKMYLDGSYEIVLDTLTPNYRVLIKFFEKALPGLDGKESHEA